MKKKLRGRPKAPEEERLSHQYRVRLTAAQHQLLRDAIDQGIEVSPLMREGGLARVRRALDARKKGRAS